MPRGVICEAITGDLDIVPNWKFHMNLQWKLEQTSKDGDSFLWGLTHQRRESFSISYYTCTGMYRYRTLRVLEAVETSLSISFVSFGLSDIGLTGLAA